MRLEDVLAVKLLPTVCASVRPNQTEARGGYINSVRAAQINTTSDQVTFSIALNHGEFHSDSHLLFL